VLYVADATGVQSVTSSSGSHRRLLSLASITSLALSRDGNFLYALAGGRLRAYSAGGALAAGSAAVEGEVIEQVAGG
jgi:hypothetical protein